MVGVAGRSKGCHTCRQRKIRCGSEKPSCRNCIKSGRPCAGYEKSPVFILSDYTLSSVTQNATTNQALTHHPHVKQQCFPIRLPKLVSSRNTTRDQLLALFIDRQLPSCIRAGSQLNDHRKWLLRLPGILQLSPALEHAILALSTAVLEKDSGDRTNQSLSLYTRGLRGMQRTIDDPKTRLDDQTLTACVLLGMFEFAECPGRTISGYMRHYQGAMTLLQLRGPRQHIGGLAHDVFQVLRTHTAFQGLAQDDVYPLARSAWLKEPWITKSKSMHDLLLDIFLQVSPLLSKGREASLSSDSHTDLETLSEFLTLNDELDGWFTNYQSTYPTLYSPQLSTTTSSTDSVELGKLFPVSFHFASYHAGETMVLYWTVQILLHASICSLHLRTTRTQAEENMPLDSQSHTFGNIQQKIQDSLFDAWSDTSARYICQSVEYFFDKRFGRAGSGVVLPPLLVVKACLSNSMKDCHRELAWIDEIVGRIQDNGVGLASCL